MGTKAKVKSRSSDPDGVEKKDKKTKRISLFRMVRKRKRLSQSQECLHDNRAENFKIDFEPVDDQEKEPDDNVEVDMENVNEHRDGAINGIQSDFSANDNDDQDHHNHHNDADSQNEKQKRSENKKKLFSLKFLKSSFGISSKKRRKQTEYSKFSESTDNILADDVDNHDNKKHEECSKKSLDNSKQGKKTNSKKYVRFEAVDDDDKENMAMAVDDEEEPHTSSTATTKKKKKFTRKRVVKAGKKTGRVFKEGMIQVGRNLQYLAPMPTPHVFTDQTKKKADYTDKPKKRNYKTTAAAPPVNAYGFI